MDYKGQIDSSSFGITPVEAISSISVQDKHLLVTIGGKGLGYVNLDNMDQSKQFITLNQPDLANYTLDDGLFMRVIVNKVFADGTLEVFVSTSNALNFVIGLKAQPGGVTYTGVQEVYNRYGKQKILNWAILNEEHLVLAYYNQSTSQETLALYKRGKKGIVNFFASAKMTVASSDLQPPKSILIDASVIGSVSSLLYYRENAKPSSTATLSMYNITGKYSLKATYSKPGNFNIIKVTASNDYSTMSREVSVEFEGDDDSGLKWYSVVIVLLLVLIAVGVAFGLYLKMKKRKVDSKKVSLFTENEEVDEIV